MRAQLRFQQVRNEPVERAVGEHILHRHALGLTEAVSAVLGLGEVCWHPVEVLEDDASVPAVRVKADAAGYQALHTADQAAVVGLKSGRQPRGRSSAALSPEIVTQ